MKLTIVIRLSALGDVAILIPALYPLAADHPDDHFLLITKKPLLKLFVDKPENIEIFAADTKGRHKGIWGVIRLAADVAEKVSAFQKKSQTPVEICIADMHNVLRSRLFRFIFFIKRAKIAVINKEKRRKRKMTRRENKHLQPLKTSFQRYIDVFCRLGYRPKSKFKSIFTEKPTHKNFRVGIAPFAKSPSKIYPLNRTEEIVRSLNSLTDTTIYLFGDKNESALLEQWAEKYRNAELVAGKMPFPDELALINSLDVMLSMDSANMHLASLTATPVVSVWGGTHPFAGFYGYGQKPENAVQTRLDCRPCSVFGNKKCRRDDFACMETIEPQTIINKIMKFKL